MDEIFRGVGLLGPVRAAFLPSVPSCCLLCSLQFVDFVKAHRENLLTLGGFSDALLLTAAAWYVVTTLVRLVTPIRELFGLPKQVGNLVKCTGAMLEAVVLTPPLTYKLLIITGFGPDGEVRQPGDHGERCCTVARTALVVC